MKTIEEMAHDLAYGLGISVYISPSGRITQNNEDGMSREIQPPAKAKPVPHALDELKNDAPA